jgi:hypothetical protein
MKKIFSYALVKIPYIILLLLVAGSMIFGILYYTGEDNTKSTALFGGLLGGIVLVIVQFLFDWHENAINAKILQLGVKNVLLHREDREFYQQLIGGSKKRIYVMGVTAKRFMEHFADSSSNRPETAVLLQALARGVEVRILLPQEQYLEPERRADAGKVQTGLESLSAQYSHFLFRKFPHPATHSILVVDDDCLLGPVFPKLSSRHTPTIHISSYSAFAQEYLKYFDNEWDQATPNV